MAGWDPLWYNPIAMNRFAYLLAALLAAHMATACTGDVIRTAAEQQKAVFDRWELGRRFDLDVRLVTSCKAGNEVTFAVDDDTGAALIRKDGVEDHIKVIFAKLGASNRAEALAIALRKHLLKM